MQAAPSQLDRFFADATARAAVGQAIPDGTILRFEILGQGGGVWVLVRQGERVVLLDAPHPTPDSALRCTADDFKALVTGRLDPREGFMSGRLQVQGDVGVVLGLHRVLRKGR